MTDQFIEDAEGSTVEKEEIETKDQQGIDTSFPSDTASAEIEQNTDVIALKPARYIVGIGASAGGLEALQDLFDYLSDDSDVAYIVVQHLSPDFKSMMDQLLRRHTRMPVNTVKDGVRVYANQVYLIPPRKNMVFSNGKLILSDQMPNPTVKNPINILFRSLAEEQQHKSVGIILSGTGSDGTPGIIAIKEVGGLVLVQNPESSKFDGMPRSAIQTNMVDFVLPPKELARNLNDYCNLNAEISTEIDKFGIGEILSEEPGQLDSSGEEDTEDAGQKAERKKVLADIFTLLQMKSTINFSLYKNTTIARRIDRRMRINRVLTLVEYRDYLHENSKELNILCKELLIGVTHFFRDEVAFKDLRELGLRQIITNSSSTDKIRIWVAGCSTGQEAYTVAMVIDDLMAEMNVVREVKVFATDVDPDAIGVAAAGVYPANISENVPAKFLHKYFNLTNNSYVAREHLRRMIIFAAHNMITDPPFSRLDLVLCRNVLIYFQHIAQRNVLSAFHFALKTKGLLFLGSSESLGELQPFFEVLSERQKVFQKNSNARLPVLHEFSKREAVAIPSRKGPKPIESILKLHRSYEKNIYGFVKDWVIEQLLDLLVIVDDEFEVMHTYGSPERYLRTIPKGEVDMSILNLVIPDLNVPVSTALHRAKQERSSVKYQDVRVVSADESEQINYSLMVTYHTPNESSSAPVYFTIMLVREDGANLDDFVEKSVGEGNIISFDEREQAQQRIRDLEIELIKNKESLQATVEELETTNEELQSANEELMSSNEELQSTNEELQSVNEELYTVNTEYQQKISELTLVNDDLKQLLAATNQGILFLDQNLVVRRYTALVCDYINILGTDVGRPVEHFRTNLDYPKFFEDIRTVLMTGSSIAHEIQTKNGSSVFVTIMSYLSERRQNIMILFSGMSELKSYEDVVVRTHLTNRAAVLQKLRNRNFGLSSLRILLLEDNKLDVVLVTKLLRQFLDHTNSIDVFSSVAETRDKIFSGRYDLCLMDYYLGDASIPKLFESMNEMQRAALPPFIVLTGDDQVDKVTMFELGALDFITKNHLSDVALESSIRYALSVAAVLDSES